MRPRALEITKLPGDQALDVILLAVPCAHVDGVIVLESVPVPHVLHREPQRGFDGYNFADVRARDVRAHQAHVPVCFVLSETSFVLNKGSWAAELPRFEKSFFSQSPNFLYINPNTPGPAPRPRYMPPQAPGDVHNDAPAAAPSMPETELEQATLLAVALRAYDGGEMFYSYISSSLKQLRERRANAPLRRAGPVAQGPPPAPQAADVAAAPGSPATPKEPPTEPPDHCPF